MSRQASDEIHRIPEEIAEKDITLAGFVPVILFTWGLSTLFKRWLHRRSTPKPRRWRSTASSAVI